MPTGPIAHKTMAHLQKATAHWKAFQAGVAPHDTRTPGERARAEREQTDGTEYHREAETQTKG